MTLTKRQLKYYQELYKKKKNPPYKVDVAAIRKKLASGKGNVPMRASKGGKVVRKRKKRD